MDDYDTDTRQPIEPPFVGRRDLYARLQQHIFDPPERRAAFVLGGRGMGKSALLWHLDRVYDESVIGVYFALDLTEQDEGVWLTRLMERTNATLTQKRFNITRLVAQPPTPTDGSDPLNLREWLRNHYLEDALRLIRPHRHLVWLFDDAEYLLDHLPQDHLVYLQRLLQQHPRLTIIMTLQNKLEHRLEEFAPLANSVRVERLTPLTEPENTDLVRQFAPGADDALVAAAYRLTGGHPLIAQTFGDYLQEQWQSGTPVPAQEAHREARNATYTTMTPFFSETWQTLNRNERLVLTAISSLLYENTSQIIDAQRIERWLIETDYPTDLTSIHAALRSLAYHDLVVTEQDHIRLTIGLWQSWLIDNARLEEVSQLSTPSLRLANTLMIIVVVLAVVVVLIFLVLNNSIGPLTLPDTLPTVTLSGS